MNRKTKQLLIFLAVLVVVGAGVALLLLLPQGGEETGASSGTASVSSTETIPLISREQSEMTSLVITNEKGTVELIAEITEPESTDASSAAAATVTYTVTGMEGVTLLNSVVQSDARYGYSLTATRDLGKQSDLAPYGLDYPAASYVATFTDGSSVTISIGDEVPGSSSKYYVMRSGDDHVYISGVASMLSVSCNDFLSGTILSLMTTDESGAEVLPTFDKIKISGRDHDQPTVIFPQAEEVAATSPLKYYSYYMSEPQEAGVTSKLVDNYLTPLANLSATGFAAVNPTDEELQEYGMDDPIVLWFWIEGEKTSLLIGKVDGSTAYVMFEGGKVIYTVDAANIALATTKAFDLRDTLMFLCDISTVATFDFVDNNGKTYTIEQQRTEKVSSSSNTSSGEATVDYDYAAYYNDLNLQYYKKFYQSFLTAYREEEVPEDAQPGAMLFSFTLNFFEEYDAEPITVAAYEYSDRRVIYQINGENMALVKREWANKVLADFIKLINDEEIKLT
ncbi:MAG: DUF4340 domain-containing protein [Firmicutes bacterium]|nr:DUF4340 domain-containing protein [Bacillota bacterium]